MPDSNAGWCTVSLNDNLGGLVLIYCRDLENCPPLGGNPNVRICVNEFGSDESPCSSTPPPTTTPPPRRPSKNRIKWLVAGIVIAIFGVSVIGAGVIYIFRDVIRAWMRAKAYTSY